jgi:hypothetical protein
MAHVCRSRIVLPLLFSVALSSSPIAAQGPARLHALAVPPSSVGTCMSTRPQRKAGDKVLAEHKLVMTTRAPNGRREITVFVDTAGRAFRYSETTNVATGILSSVGQAVIAEIDSAGHVHGFRIHTSVRAADTISSPLDTATLRKMRQRAVVKSSHEPLDAADQRKVKELVALLRTRCPI